LSNKPKRLNKMLTSVLALLFLVKLFLKSKFYAPTFILVFRVSLSNLNSVFFQFDILLLLAEKAILNLDLCHNF